MSDKKINDKKLEDISGGERYGTGLDTECGKTLDTGMFPGPYHPVLRPKQGIKKTEDDSASEKTNSKALI